MARRLHPTSNDSIMIASAAATLPSPPTLAGVVPDGWESVRYGSVPEVDLNVYGAATIEVTGAALLGAKGAALTFADKTVTATHGTDTLALNTHGLKHGDGPVRIAAAVTLPTGFEADVDYWVIFVDANSFKLAASLADALANTPVDITSNGSGALTVSDVPASSSVIGTRRLTWYAIDELPASIDIADQVGYGKRFAHRPGTLAYALAGTLDTGAVSATITPVYDRN